MLVWSCFHVHIHVGRTSHKSENMAWSDIELHVGGEDTGTSGFGAAPGKGNSVSGGYQVDKLVTITAGAKVRTFTGIT